MNFRDVQSAVRRSVAPEVVEKWSRPQGWLCLGTIAWNWFVIVLVLGISAKIPAPFAMPFAFFMIGWRQYALFILGHDGIHGTLHRNRVWNDRLARWFVYAPLFMSLEDARSNHLEHHRHVGSAEDPDRYLHTIQNKNSAFKFLMYCSGLMTFAKTLRKVTPLGGPRSQKGALKGYLLSRWPILPLQALIFLLFAGWGYSFWDYAVLWVLPIYVCVFLPDEIRAYCDHAVLMPDHAADPKRLVSFKPGWFEAMVFSPLHMNYHAEHHLWPSVPHYNLPHVHRAVRERPEISYRGSYLAFLADSFRTLPIHE